MHRSDIAEIKPNAQDEGVPVSVKIRERIVAARKRFHANDNIAQFIEPGELEALLDEVEIKMQGVLDSLVKSSRAATSSRPRSPNFPMPSI